MSAIMVKMAYLAPTRLKCSGPLDHTAQSLTEANRNWQTKYGVEKKQLPNSVAHHRQSLLPYLIYDF